MGRRRKEQNMRAVSRSMKALWHYGLFQLAIVLSFIWYLFNLTSKGILELWAKYLKFIHLPRNTILIIYLSLMVGIVLILYALYLSSVTYKDATGRSLRSDRAEFDKTRGYLLNFYKKADPLHLDSNTLPVENWKNAEGVILGKVNRHLVKRKSAGEGNFLLFGRPGDGKTTCQIIPTAQRFDGSVLAIDIKGDILNWTNKKRNIKIFAPDDKTKSLHFDPLSGVAEMDLTKRKLYIKNLSFVIIPDETGDNSSFFVDGGRDFFNGIALYMLHKDPHCTFIDIVNAILKGNAFDWVITVMKSDVPEAQDYLNAYYGANEKNVAGQYKKVTDGVRPFTDGDLGELLKPSKNSITPQMLDDGYDIYIEIPQDKIKIYAPITTILVQNFMDFFMERSDSSTGKELRPILFLLDEFPQLNFNYDTLSSALATLRSKKVSLFMACQSIAQLEHRYKDTGSRGIIDNAAYISIMSAQDPRSREMFSKLVGTKKILKATTSKSSNNGNTSFSRSVQDTREPVYQPEAFGNLNDKVVIIYDGKYIEADKCKCYEKTRKSKKGRKK